MRRLQRASSVGDAVGARKLLLTKLLLMPVANVLIVVIAEAVGGEHDIEISLGSTQLNSAVEEDRESRAKCNTTHCAFLRITAVNS